MPHITLHIPLDPLLNAVEAIVDEKLKAHSQAILLEQFLSVAKARNLFSPTISTPSINKLVKDGLLPQYRVGRRVFYKYIDVINVAKSYKKHQRG